MHDDGFTTVANPGVDNEDTLQKVWLELIKSGHEKYFDPDDLIDANGKLIPPPPLHDQWLTERERRRRMLTRRDYVSKLTTFRGDNEGNDNNVGEQKIWNDLVVGDAVGGINAVNGNDVKDNLDPPEDDGFGRHLLSGESNPTLKDRLEALDAAEGDQDNDDVLSLVDEGELDEMPDLVDRDSGDDNDDVIDDDEVVETPIVTRSGRRIKPPSRLIQECYQERMKGAYYSKLYSEAPRYFIAKGDRNIKECLT